MAVATAGGAVRAATESDRGRAAAERAAAVPDRHPITGGRSRRHEERGAGAYRLRRVAGSALVPLVGERAAAGPDGERRGGPWIDGRRLRLRADGRRRAGDRHRHRGGRAVRRAAGVQRTHPVICGGGGRHRDRRPDATSHGIRGVAAVAAVPLVRGRGAAGRHRQRGRLALHDGGRLRLGGDRRADLAGVAAWNRPVVAVRKGRVLVPATALVADEAAAVGVVGGAQVRADWAHFLAAGRWTGRSPLVDAVELHAAQDLAAVEDGVVAVEVVGGRARRQAGGAGAGVAGVGIGMRLAVAGRAAGRTAADSRSAIRAGARTGLAGVMTVATAGASRSATRAGARTGWAGVMPVATEGGAVRAAAESDRGCAALESAATVPDRRPIAGGRRRRDKDRGAVPARHGLRRVAGSTTY